MKKILGPLMLSDDFAAEAGIDQRRWDRWQMYKYRQRLGVYQPGHRSRRMKGK